MNFTKSEEQREPKLLAEKEEGFVVRWFGEIVNAP
jgi:hypothetical protein